MKRLYIGLKFTVSNTQFNLVIGIYLVQFILYNIVARLAVKYIYDIVEAHYYFVDIGRIDREQIRSRINNNDCRTFRPRRPLSTAYRTKETAV